MVYVGALALLDFLSGSVTGPWLINNYVECGMGEDDSPVLDKTRFAAISAEFTICTANLITLVLSVERLFAVACSFLYRQKSSIKRSVIILSCVVLESSHEFCHLQLQTQARPPFIRTRFHVWLTDSSTRYPTYPLCEVNGLSLTKYSLKARTRIWN